MFHHRVTTPDDPHAKDQADSSVERDEDAEDRAAILRRRAVFIASAVAGLGVAGCFGDPRPCLDVYVPPNPSTGTGTGTGATTDGDPAPCLTVAVPETPDAGTPTPPDPLDGGQTDADPPPPAPCLKVAPPRPCLSPPAPRPCLSQTPPRPCLDMKP